MKNTTGKTAVCACLLSALLLDTGNVSADDSDSVVIAQAFDDILEGDLPSEWDGADAVGVRKNGDAAWLEAPRVNFKCEHATGLR